MIMVTILVSLNLFLIPPATITKSFTLITHFVYGCEFLAP
jgi:hypothetical protein